MVRVDRNLADVALNVAAAKNCGMLRSSVDVPFLGESNSLHHGRHSACSERKRIFEQMSAALFCSATSFPPLPVFVLSEAEV